jgi:hypothetical protein
LSKDTGLLPQGLNNVTLTNPTPTQQDQIGSTSDEVSGSQLFDLPAVEGFGVELPIEAFQGFIFGKVRFPDATLDGTFAASAGLLAEELIEKVQMREILFFGFGEQYIQRFGSERNTQNAKWLKH